MPTPEDRPDADTGEVTTSRSFTLDAASFGPQVVSGLSVAAPTPGQPTMDLSVRRANYTSPGTNQYVNAQKKAYATFSFDNGVTVKSTYTIKLVQAQENMGEHPEVSSKEPTKNRGSGAAWRCSDA